MRPSKRIILSLGVLQSFLVQRVWKSPAPSSWEDALLHMLILQKILGNVGTLICFQGLLDRIVMVDSAAKIHALFNYEQSHIFGLR